MALKTGKKSLIGFAPLEKNDAEPFGLLCLPDVRPDKSFVLKCRLSTCNLPQWTTVTTFFCEFVKRRKRGIFFFRMRFDK